MMDWQDAVQTIVPHIVKISTPQGWGTGFFLTHTQSGIVAVATAAHVVQHAHMWEESLRIHHHGSEKTTIVRPANRAIFIDEGCDAATILFVPGEIRFPDSALRLVPEGKFLRTGNDVGWLGFPSVAPQTLCFFSGRVSAWVDDRNRYLIDGVAINGVSGGPAFFIAGDDLLVMGAMSAYHPNRSGGTVLPGLCIVTDVAHFVQSVSRIRSMEEAKEKEDESKGEVEIDDNGPSGLL